MQQHGHTPKNSREFCSIFCIYYNTSISGCSKCSLNVPKTSGKVCFNSRRHLLDRVISFKSCMCHAGFSIDIRFHNNVRCRCIFQRNGSDYTHKRYHNNNSSSSSSRRSSRTSRTTKHNHWANRNDSHGYHDRHQRQPDGARCIIDHTWLAYVVRGSL